jgi:hypothetical protein
MWTCVVSQMVRWVVPCAICRAVQVAAVTDPEKRSVASVQSTTATSHGLAVLRMVSPPPTDGRTSRHAVATTSVRDARGAGASEQPLD